MAQREVIRPSTNIPVLVLLDSEPTQKESNFGPPIQWQYICNDGAAIMWLDPAAHAAIERTGARPGDVVSLCKRGGGSRSTWEAEVQPVTDETGLPDNEGLGKGQPHQEPAPRQAPRPAPQPAPPAPNPRAPRNGATRHGSGNAHTDQAEAAPAKAPGEAQQRPGARVLAAALCTAIDAIQEAEAYAQSKGLALNFSVDDVRALGISLFISAEKAGQ